MSLTLRPSTLHEANALVAAWHRHSRPVRGCRFALVALDGGEVVGVAIVGRPLSRQLQDATTAEIIRVCTNGHPNACSFLYGACRKAWQAMGGRRLITYTLTTEPGSSLRAAGMVRERLLIPNKNWTREARPRPNSSEPNPARIRWGWQEVTRSA